MGRGGDLQLVLFAGQSGALSPAHCPRCGPPPLATFKYTLQLCSSNHSRAENLVILELGVCIYLFTTTAIPPLQQPHTHLISFYEFF